MHGSVEFMFTTASAPRNSAIPASVAPVASRANVTISATWYATGINAFTTFGHKHPSRRSLS
jgi:hypothetical protein